MRESSKTNKYRHKNFGERYLQGVVLDIGAGNDLVCEWAEPFDLVHGDANDIKKYRQPNSYDTVHSSHCLEHMENPYAVISDWWELVKPGGYLIIIVPDEDLYEQGYWPSRFNSDHKHTFTIDSKTSWSPCSINLIDLVRGLKDSEILSAILNDKNYNYKLRMQYPHQHELTSKWSELIRRVYIRVPYLRGRLDRIHKIFEFYFLKKPIDQTLGSALAQIEVVVKKRVVGV